MKSTRITLLFVLMIAISIFMNATPLSHAQTEEKEWWEIGPSLITFTENIAGLCYPWLVTRHFLINLATNTTQPGVGGDYAVFVDSCTQSFFVVRGAFGVYVFSRDSGIIIDNVLLTPYMRYIGSSGESIGVYDERNSVVMVKLPYSKTTALVPVNRAPLDIKYSFTSSLPIVVYSSVFNNTVQYYVANPGVTKQIPRTGTGAVYIESNRVYIESNNGLLVLEITDPLNLGFRELFFIPLPVRLSAFAYTVGDYLLAYSGEILIKINVNERSTEFRKVELIGGAIPTPIGYYTPYTYTTYVVTENGVYPVPGFAVGRLRNAVFTNIYSRLRNTTVPAMWSIVPTTFVTMVQATGVLYDGEYAIRLSLPPGSYRLVRDGVFNDGIRNIFLSEPEVYYPPSIQPTPPPSVVSNIRYHVSEFPSNYVPLESFSSVNYVSSGAGRALIIQSNRAVVYAGYGTSAVIPGTWQYGGVGDCVVLYDGASFRLYDYSGEPITSLSYYLIREPNYVTCRRVSVSDYVVEVYTNDYGEKIIISTEARTESNPTKAVSDPRGATIYMVNPRVEYASIVVPVPLTASELRVSGFWASWMTSAGVNILSLTDSTIYVLTNPPANTTIYPVNNELIAVYHVNEKRVDILPYKAFFIQNCYIDVATKPEAEVYLNNKYVATGSTRIYVPCNSRVTVEARQLYHKPKSASVFVTGPVRVELTPEPIIANVSLNVIAPKGLRIEAVAMYVDGNYTVWRVDEVRQLIAKPTTFTVSAFMPIDVCTKETYNVTLVEGSNIVNIYCRLTAPILAMTSTVQTNVKIYVVGMEMPTQVASISPDSPTYVVAPFGDIRIVSEPVAPGYVAKEIDVKITDVKVYEVDVTPYPMSKIIVQSNVPTATITVYNETGEAVGTGVGTLEVQVLPGKYTVIAQAPNYATYSTTVEVPPGEAVTVPAILRYVAPVEEAPVEKPFWESFEFQIIAIVAVVGATIFVLWYKRRKARAVVEEVVESTG